MRILISADVEGATGVTWTADCVPDATHLAAAAAVVPTVDLVGPRRVGCDAASMTLAMQAFKVVTGIAAGAVEELYG